MSLTAQQVDKRALIERLAAPFRTPEFRAAQQSRLDALADALDGKYAPAKAQQDNDVSG